MGEQRRRFAERLNVLVVLGPKTLNTLIVFDFLERESVETSRWFGDVGAKTLGPLMVLTWNTKKVPMF